MAAIFYKSDITDQSIFAGGLTVITSVKFDFLESLLTEANLTFVTDVNIQHNDTVQFFLTFDDLVSWFFFGKGLGTINIRGVICCACNDTKDGNTPGVSALLGKTIPNIRGKAVKMSIGNTVFSGVLTSFTLNATQDPAPIIEFGLSLALVRSTIPNLTKQPVTCDFTPAGATQLNDFNNDINNIA